MAISSTSPVTAALARLGLVKRFRIELIRSDGLSLQTIFPHNVRARDLLKVWRHYLESLDDRVTVDIGRIDLSGPIQPHTEVRQLLFTDEASASPDEVDISLCVVRKAQHRPKSWRLSMLSSVGEPHAVEIIHLNVISEWNIPICCLDVPRHIKIKNLKFIIEKNTSYLAPAQVLVNSENVDDNKCLHDYVRRGKTYAGLFVKLDLQKQVSLPGGRKKLITIHNQCLDNLDMPDSQ
ncbi:hypothetical protein A1Q2_06809 [Trichosporon asahii var. asahii CBS 8904]|uniref:Uncharacterized protein n=1 Tax=Trichosporon asahii var. asahii (strain CBS 8904) TaxID=1220162 RepID=K1WB07_TRIAC|nr:hypothetical protein A1Q2_06809 [Trichosporon asahii var. asahii CBS 8904]